MSKDKLIIKYKGKYIYNKLPELLDNLKPYETLEFIAGVDDRKYHIKLVSK